MTAPLGIVRNLDADIYHRDDSVSNSMLSSLSRSPAHCYALHIDPARPERKPTAAMAAGTLAHAAILEPHALHDRYVVKPDGMSFVTKDGNAWRAEQTRIIVDADQMQLSQAQRKAVMSHAALGKLLTGTTDAEASVFWMDIASDLRCRCRPDLLHWHSDKEATALDIKTISDLTPKAVARAVAEYGYHRQAAFYSQGCEAAGITIRRFVFGFVSSSYPVLAAAFQLDEETLMQGYDEIAELLELYASCKQSGVWPAFGDDVQPISLPVWAKRSGELEVSYV